MSYRTFVLIAALALLPAQGQPQNTDSGQLKWEYCRAIAALTGVAHDGIVEGTVSVCFMTEKGCRMENITVSETASASERSRQYRLFAVAEAARAKALAQLGAAGWEMVTAFHDTSESTIIYMKRMLR